MSKQWIPKLFVLKMYKNFCSKSLSFIKTDSTDTRDLGKAFDFDKKKKDQKHSGMTK